MAQGTVLAVMLGPMSLLGILAMRERTKKNLKFAIIGVIFYAFFSYLGAYLAFLLNTNNLKVIFSLFLLILGFSQLFNFKYSKKQFKLNLLSMSLVGIFVGVIGGLFGIGAGVLMVPIFINLFNLNKDDARVLSLMILLPPVSLGAVIKYQSENSINWIAALIIFATYFVTNYFGSKLAKNQSSKQFKFYYGIILIIISLINIYITLK